MKKYILYNIPCYLLTVSLMIFADYWWVWLLVLTPWFMLDRYVEKKWRIPKKVILTNAIIQFVVFGSIWILQQFEVL